MNEKSWDYLRPEVQAFAVAMEAELRANDHKAGWKNDDPLELCERVQQELDELIAAIEGNEEGGAEDVDVLKEAADVGNFAMMIWDNVRNWDKVRKHMGWDMAQGTSLATVTVIDPVEHVAQQNER